MMNKNSFYVVSVGKNVDGARIMTLLGDVEFDSDIYAFRHMISNALNAGALSMADALEKWAVIMTPAGLTFKQVIEEIEKINGAEIAAATPKCNCHGCVNRRAAAKMAADGVKKDDPFVDLLGSLMATGLDVLIDVLKDAKKDAERRDN